MCNVYPLTVLNSNLRSLHKLDARWINLNLMFTLTYTIVFVRLLAMFRGKRNFSASNLDRGLIFFCAHFSYMYNEYEHLFYEYFSIRLSVKQQKRNNLG